MAIRLTSGVYAKPLPIQRSSDLLVVAGEIIGAALMAAGPAVALCCAGVEASTGYEMARTEAERRTGHCRRVGRMGAVRACAWAGHRNGQRRRRAQEGGGGADQRAVR